MSLVCHVFVLVLAATIASGTARATARGVAIVPVGGSGARR